MMNTEDELFDNELHLAVRVGDIKLTRKALKQGFNPNTIGLFEWSALHEAAHNGEFEIVKVLLKNGGDPNHQDYLNGSTALHYAATEGHPKCLDLLLSHGCDVSIKNDKGLTFPQMTRQKACKDVLSKHGIDVTTSVHFDDSSYKCNTIPETSSPKPTIETHSRSAAHPPTSYNAKTVSKSYISDGSFESGIGSRTSLSDSGSISSSMCRSPILRGGSRSYLSDQPSSPCKSYSSFGSLTSIGSSIISGSDDCAGYITMAFQYNSKTSQLKIRVTEIVLTCLLSYQKVRKDTTWQLNVGGKIYVPNEISLENNRLNIQAKSESFRLQPGGDPDNPIEEKDGSVKTFWRERDAKMTFATALLVEFVDIKKDLLKNSHIQVSISAKHKKNVLTKSPLSTFATLDLPLKDAVKRLMKETYELQPCHVHGITRNEEKLDQVLSEMVIASGKQKCPSVHSDSRIRGRNNETFELEVVERSVSDGDLKQVMVNSSATTSLSSSSYDIEDEGESVQELQGVFLHHTENRQVEVEMADAQNGFLLDRKELKLDMPSVTVKAHSGKSNKEVLKKARGRIQQVATGGAKSLHRLVVSRNQTEIEKITIDEEQKLGSPPEEIQLTTFSSCNSSKMDNTEETKLDFISKETVDKKILSSPGRPRTVRTRTHVRTSSNDSFTKVDESSPSRRRRDLRKQFSSNTGTHSRPDSPAINLKHETNAKSPSHSLMYEDSNDFESHNHLSNPWLVEGP